MNLITMTACNRPEYTQAVLAALARCHGIERYQLLVRCEPGNDDVLKVIAGSPVRIHEIKLNQTRLGCCLNTCAALDDGFKLKNFLIHIEDDTVPSPDFLAYMEWAEARYINDPEIFSIASYHRSPEIPADQYLVSRRSYFTCWGFGLWKRKWEKVRELARGGKALETWACPTCQFVVDNHYKEIYPLLSRCQNIGERGVHVPSPEWHRQNQHCEHTADCPPGNYNELIPL